MIFWRDSVTMTNTCNNWYQSSLHYMNTGEFTLQLFILLLWNRWLLTKLKHEMCFPMAVLRMKCCLRQRKSDMMGYIQIPGNLVYLAHLFALSTNSTRYHSINRFRIWLHIFQWILNSLFWTGLNLRKHSCFNSE